jgi:hypothetical protein
LVLVVVAARLLNVSFVNAFIGVTRKISNKVIPDQLSCRYGGP